MHACLRSRYAPLCLALLGFLVLLAGCGQPVREERSINWSKQGDAVGFQQGEAGVFLADKEGRKLTKIFQPDPSILATSTPLWSPTGKCVLFTTARNPAGQQPVNFPLPGGELDPAGNLHFQQEILYTCWLYEPSTDEKPTQPIPLFEASADHVGYVAANLAVRWHPHQDRIAYVKQVAAHQHGLFEYDLTTKRSTQLFPHTSEALLFDWAPDGAHLVCVLGSTQRVSTDGIWIGQPSQQDWWQVPQSGALAPGEFGSLLEQLRSTRPAWTHDGRRFAFPSYLPGPTPQQPGRHFLRQATLAKRTVDVWAEGEQPFRDLHWDPNGQRLGVVCGNENGTLHLIQQGQSLSPALNRQPVRRFAGWSADGTRLAYVVPDELHVASTEPWSLLLLADPLARDKVYVAAGDGSDPGQPVFSGMRVTFPQWSPQEEKLSLWVTFLPVARSIVSYLFGWGLRPGDPAAVLDARTGQLAWLPINPQEKIQVGHYFQLKRDYTQAWHWYREAERELPPPGPVLVRDFNDYLHALQGPRDLRFFQYQCLTKLGRREEAQAKREQFRRFFLPRFTEPAPVPAAPANGAEAPLTPERQLQALLDPGGFMGALLQDLYEAEVFLSLDSAADAEAFFRSGLEQADKDAVRLSRALALSQILLLEKKDQEYAALATERIAPLLVQVLKPASVGGRRDFMDATTLTEYVGALALLPLGAPEFLSRLPAKQVQEMALRWHKLRTEANEISGPLLDLVLRGLYQTLGQEQERQAVATRLKSWSAASPFLPLEDDPGKTIAMLRSQMRELMQRR